LGVQDLINKMLHPEPLKRMTIAEIKAHPWYNEQVPTQTALRSELEERLATTLKNKRLEQLQREKEEREAKEAAKGNGKPGAASAATGGVTGDSAMDRLRAHKAREAKLKEEKATAAANRLEEAKKERIAAEKQKEERRAEQQRKLRELQEARRQRQVDMKEKLEREKADAASKRTTISSSSSTTSLGRRLGSASLTRDAARKLTRDFSRTSTGGAVSGPVIIAPRALFMHFVLSIPIPCYFLGIGTRW
jgi:flagellar biosynthesis GTPase FlhF